MASISYDSALSDLADISQSQSGIGGNSTIVPIYSTNEIYGYFWTRDLMDAFAASLWQCHRVVSCKPYAMLNSWGKLNVAQGDRQKEDRANQFFRGLAKKYCHGQILANQHGGSTVIRFVEDGRSADQPIDLDNIKKIKYSRIFDRWECYPDPLSYMSDPTSPEYYLIALNPQERSHLLSGDLYQGTYLSSKETYYRIHKDRVLRFDGEFIGAESQIQNQGWHASKLIRFLPPLLRYLEAMGYVSAAMKSFEMVLFLVDDLFKMLATPQGKNQILERARVNQQMLTAVRGMLVDRKREGVQVVSRNFANTDAIIKELRYEMQGASGLDQIELFNEHPTGLAATGQSQRLEKARQTSQLCRYHWGENLEGNSTEDKIGDIELYLRSQDSDINPDSDYEWIWSQDIAITPEEKSQIYVNYSQGDRNYQQTGSLTAYDIRSRFEGNNFEDELILNNNSFKEQSKLKTMPEEKPISTQVNQDSDPLLLDLEDQELMQETEYERLIRQVETEGDRNAE